MNFLLPGFLAGGLLIGLPVALHFLRSKPKRLVHFPTLRFLGASAIRDTRRHRLRRWLTLALRCLVIALLAAAFARPFFANQDTARRRVMIVAVDNSMSMQTGNRWEEGLRWAMRQLEELEPVDHAGVLLINPAPVWVAPVSSDPAQARVALSGVRMGFEKTRYSGALRLAGETLAAHPSSEKTLIWMADEQRVGWLGADFNAPLPAGTKVRFGETAPEPARQAAIISARWTGESVELNVRLFSPERDTRRVTVRAGDRVLAEQLAAALVRGENKLTLPVKLPEEPSPDGIRVSINADNLAADDSAWIVTAHASAAKPVLLDAVAETDFLAHALRSTRELAAGALEPAVFPLGDWPRGAIAIARGADLFRSPAIERLNRFADTGGPVWIFFDGSPDQTRWLAGRGVHVTERSAPVAGTPWHLRDWEPEHPALAAFAGRSLLPLMEIEFYRGFDLEGEKLTPIARWPDGAIALAEWNASGRRMLLAGFPLEGAATNWTGRPSFVPFVHGAVRWLSAMGNPRTDWRVGDTIPLPAGEGTWRVLDSPRSDPERAVSGSVRPGAPGLYEFVADQTRQVFAVNVPAEESDLAPWPRPEQFAALESQEPATRVSDPHAGPRLSDLASEGQQRLWWWLLAICGAGLLAELALANRTAM